MRIFIVLPILAIALASCAQEPPVQQVTSAVPAVVVVEKAAPPQIIVKEVPVERRVDRPIPTSPKREVVVVEKPVVIENKTVVEKEKTTTVVILQPQPKKRVTKAASAKCRMVSGYTRANGTKVAPYQRCRKS